MTNRITTIKHTMLGSEKKAGNPLSLLFINSFPRSDNVEYCN